MNAIISLTPDRRSAQDSRSFRTTLRAYCIETKFEFLRMLRTPAFAVPMLVLPVMLYVLFAALIFGETTAKNPQMALYMFASYVVFAVTTPGVFGFGTGLAVERQAGMLRLKRALPMPFAGNLIAKTCMSVGVALLVVSILFVLAVSLGHVKFTAQQIATVFSAAALGAITSCAIGFCIGSMVPGQAASGVVNLIYFPMMYLSGMFFPLPAFLAKWAIIWPTFYMDQLVIAAGGGKAFMDPGMCIGVLVGVTVLFGGLAIRQFGRQT
jgi:ABC-2 type transport system permease protein